MLLLKIANSKYTSILLPSESSLLDWYPGQIMDYQIIKYHSDIRHY